MIFNVSGLVQDGIGASREYELDEALDIEGGEPERVYGGVRLLRSMRGVLVFARLNVVHRDTCSRCLEPSEETLPVEFEEEFQASVDLQTGRPLEEQPEPDVFLIDSRHILDISEAVRQYREASVHMQPLCRPDCKGLCPECGSNLNDGDCSCESAPIDIRWAGLAALAGKQAEADSSPVTGKE